MIAYNYHAGNMNFNKQQIKDLPLIMDVLDTHVKAKRLTVQLKLTLFSPSTEHWRDGLAKFIGGGAVGGRIN